jgi:hypothetical protein
MEIEIRVKIGDKVVNSIGVTFVHGTVFRKTLQKLCNVLVDMATGQAFEEAEAAEMG